MCEHEELGGGPFDDAEAYAGEVVAGAAEGAPVSARYQGGTFCALGYDRAEFAPDELFAWRVAVRGS